jgi:hypothetical protein
MSGCAEWREMLRHYAQTWQAMILEVLFRGSVSESLVGILTTIVKFDADRLPHRLPSGFSRPGKLERRLDVHKPCWTRKT